MHRFWLEPEWAPNSQLWSDSGSYPAILRCKNLSSESSTSLSEYQCGDCLLIIVSAKDGGFGYNDISPVGNNQKTAEFQLNLW